MSDTDAASSVVDGGTDPGQTSVAEQDSMVVTSEITKDPSQTAIEIAIDESPVVAVDESPVVAVDEHNERLAGDSEAPAEANPPPVTEHSTDAAVSEASTAAADVGAHGADTDDSNPALATPTLMVQDISELYESPDEDAELP